MKFSLHVIDDNKQFKNMVAEALFQEGVCDELLDYRFFQTVGAAKKHYKTVGGHFPDIALVDIEFMDDDINAEEKGDLKGFELIEYFAENSPATHVFAFTAKSALDEVANQLDLLDLFSKTIEKGSMIGGQVRLRVQRILKERAASVVKNIAANYQNELRNLPENWAEMEVGEKGFRLPQLLVGWGDVRNQDRKSIQNILDELLAVPLPIQFRGNWAIANKAVRAESAERLALRAYQNEPREAYQMILKGINRRAFDLLVELVNINETLAEEQYPYRLSHPYFRGFCVTQNVANNPMAFLEKLVGRRAVLAFDTHIDRFGKLTLEETAFLLRDSVLQLSDEDRPNPSYPVFNTNLGIEIMANGMLNTNSGHLLAEESDFIEHMGEYGKAFANFLSEMHFLPIFLRHLNGESLPNLTALSAFFQRTRQLGVAEDAIFQQQFQQFFDHQELLNVPAPTRRTIFNLYGMEV